VFEGMISITMEIKDNLAVAWDGALQKANLAFVFPKWADK